MSKADNHRSTRAKRKLNLENIDEPVEKNPKSANTAVEVTEYTSRSKHSTGNANGKNCDRRNKEDQAMPKQKLDEKTNKRKNLTPKRAKGRPAKRDNSVPRELSAEKPCTSETQTEIGENFLPASLSQESNEIPDNLSGNDQSHYDGVLVRINESDDDFNSDIDDEVYVKANKKSEEPDKEEEIPPEVVEQLKKHPVMQEYIGEVVSAAVNAKMMEFTSKQNERVVNKSPKRGAPRRRNSGEIPPTQKILKSPSDTTIYRPCIAKRNGRFTRCIKQNI